MAETILVTLLIVPLVTGLVCGLLRSPRTVETFNAIGAVMTAALAAGVVADVARDGPIEALWGLLWVDALSALMIGTIATLGFAAAVGSIPYLRHDLRIGHVPLGRRGLRWYYLGLHLFVWTMLATVSVDNLGLLWVGVEATTLASALLVGFYRTQAALEAAWKYLILCTVGITCALFGVLLTYYAARQGGESASLDWSSLSGHAEALDPALMRLAFVFVLVGFGTKAGFAPLHTWLADAHSQAPSPISGLLSGVLLTCALYGILRFHVLTTGATASDFSSHLLLAFGVLSVAVAAPFILIQRDLKRLLAYSSVEHLGIMAVAFGIGGPVAVAAGALHLVNHAATKTLLFFAAGDLVQRYGTRRIGAIHDALRVAPLAGRGLLLGVCAITGLPPFGIFVSELGIVGAGLRGDWPAVAAVTAVVLILGVIFAGLLSHALRVAYGPRPSAATVVEPTPWRAQPALLIALAPLACVMILFGIHVPDAVTRLLDDVAVVLGPVAKE